MPTEREPPTPIARFLRDSRKAAGLSQNGLARELQTRQSTVSEWERGRNGIGLDVLYRLKVPLKWTQRDIDRAIGLIKAEAKASVERVEAVA